MLWKERLPGHPLSSEHARNNKKKVKLNCEELPDLRFGYLFISVHSSKFGVLGYISEKVVRCRMIMQRFNSEVEKMPIGNIQYSWKYM